MSGRLDGQVAWVSGASSGMGEAIAELFAEEGAAVALIDVQAEKGRAVAKRIADRGGRALFIECDVRREEAVRDSIFSPSRAHSAFQQPVSALVRVTA